MTEKALFKELYFRMTNEQLINWAKHQGQYLTGSSFSTLYEEVDLRNLDVSILINPTLIKVDADNNIIENTKVFSSSENEEALWALVFNEKENRKSDLEIYDQLINKGYTHLFALTIIGYIAHNTRHVLKTLDEEILTGIILLLAGITVAIWKYSAIVSGSIYVAALAGILIGIFIIIKGVTSKSKYKTILNIIETERIESEDASLPM